jgi:hypothetical protein
LKVVLVLTTEPESDSGEVRYDESSTVGFVRPQTQQEKADYLRDLANSITNHQPHLQNTTPTHFHHAQPRQTPAISRNDPTLAAIHEAFYMQHHYPHSPQNQFPNPYHHYNSPQAFAHESIRAQQQAQFEQRYRYPQFSAYNYPTFTQTQEGYTLNVPNFGGTMPPNQTQPPTNFFPQPRP